LIEVLVAIFIGVLLAGIVTVNVVRYVAESRVKAARIQIRELKGAVEQYMAEQGRPPSMEQGLEALVRAPSIPPVPRKYPEGGYLSSRRLPRDPWGREYVYIVPGADGQPFEIISYGSDGEPGGEGDAADISSADLGSEF
jgi:general secretion pathway protein G